MTLCQVVKDLHLWTPEEKNALRRVMEYGLRTWPDLIHCVRELQGQLLFNAGQSNYDFQQVIATDLRLVQLARAGNYEEALNEMARELRSAVEKLWPDCDLPRYHTVLRQQAARHSEQRTRATGQETVL